MVASRSGTRRGQEIRPGFRGVDQLGGVSCFKNAKTHFPHPTPIFKSRDRGVIFARPDAARWLPNQKALDGGRWDRGVTSSRNIPDTFLTPLTSGV